MEDAVQKLALWCSTFEAKSFGPRDVIMTLTKQSDHVFFLRTGYARLYTLTRDGREVTLVIYKPGSLIPLSFLLSTERLEGKFVLEALSSVQGFTIPLHSVESYFKKTPDILWYFLERLSNALTGLVIRIEQSLSDKPQEIVGILSYLASEFGTSYGTDGEILIPFPLTSEQLATWTGTARETVARTVSTLKKQGLIRSYRKKVVVRKLPVLRAFNP